MISEKKWYSNVVLHVDILKTCSLFILNEKIQFTMIYRKTKPKIQKVTLNNSLVYFFLCLVIHLFD